MVKNNISRLARAKINLDLLLTGQRDDGYHFLDSIVVFADTGDELSFLPAEKLTLSITGPFAEGLKSEDNNLILQAGRLLKDKFKIQGGAEISLVKNLPVSSGIGGGSADAAATLNGLMQLWGIESKIETLGTLPLSLGADVPVCLMSRTVQMTGIGEELKPVGIDFPIYLVLVNPSVAVSTADIFKSHARKSNKYSTERQLPHYIRRPSELLEMLNESGNDLEEGACIIQPVIKEALSILRDKPGCHYSAMSGSGATCFGIFESLDTAKTACQVISAEFPTWWVKATQTK